MWPSKHFITQSRYLTNGAYTFGCSTDPEEEVLLDKTDIATKEDYRCCNKIRNNNTKHNDLRCALYTYTCYSLIPYFPTGGIQDNFTPFGSIISVIINVTISLISSISFSSRVAGSNYTFKLCIQYAFHFTCKYYSMHLPEFDVKPNSRENDSLQRVDVLWD
jgi:hypothetical protein